MNKAKYDAKHFSKLTAAKAMRTKERKDFSKSETELVDVVDTLQRAISMVKKEMTKNPAFEQKDTEIIHRTVKRGTISCYLKEDLKNSDGEAYHRADHDDSRGCSQHC